MLCYFLLLLLSRFPTPLRRWLDEPKPVRDIGGTDVGFLLIGDYCLLVATWPSINSDGALAVSLLGSTAFKSS